MMPFQYCSARIGRTAISTLKTGAVVAALLAGSTLASRAQEAGADGPAPVAAPMTVAQLAAQIEAERDALEARGASQVEWLLFDGKVLKITGQYAEAAKVYRQVLQLDPDNLVARQELAHALFLARDFRAAKFHFETLDKADPDQARRGLYQRFLGLIDQNQPFGVSGYFSLVPSTNVNRGTTNATFTSSLGVGTINEVNQETSGLGVAAGASGYFRRILSNTRRVSLNWGLSGTRYEETSFDNTTATVGVALETIEPWGNWQISPFARRNWREPDSLGNDYDNEAFGLRGSVRYVIDARHRLSASLSHEIRDYDSQDQNDGPFTSAQISVERQLSPALSVSAGFGLERSRPDSPVAKYNGVRVFAGGARLWTGGLQTSAQIEFGQRPFTQNFNGLTEPRRDEYGRISLGVQHGKVTFQGFAPLLNCSHTVNASNVAFFDYEATDCQIALTRNF